MSAVRYGCLALLLAPVVAVGGCVARFTFWPAEEVTIELPEALGVAHVQVWGNTMSEGRHELLVRTPRGSVRRVMWEDWGPAQRTSLYLTPGRHLVAIGGGSVAAVVTVDAGARPALGRLDGAERESERWRYLGAVDRDDRRGYFLWPPNQFRECNAEFGAGSIPYRRTAVEHDFCPSPQMLTR